jgi:hypothetical protein
MYFTKWLVDLNSISGAVLTPLHCTSETLVIIYQTTFLHKAQDCNLQIIILHAVLQGLTLGLGREEENKVLRTIL